jgi:hypothetical protein
MPTSTADQILTRNLAIIEEIKSKVLNYVKERNIRIGWFDISPAGPGRYVLTLENNGEAGDDINTLIHRMDRCVAEKPVEYKGSFDWASDTYIKDASLVYFRIT